ncbi:winged helix-turn-helix domain-containing protein [Dactylosporangium darangshiense]|uniref:HTH gntR-type domain-containing protein n=1 Tax=Dactylosporangium darangshiense TaxID=579108 RepID=A0ABP8CTZ1_9ACTN
MPVKYREVAEKLRERIHEGLYPPGARLPSEAGMAKDFGCSVDTIRDAISVLSREGYVSRHRGQLAKVRAEVIPTAIELPLDARVTARPMTLEEYDAIGCGPGIAMFEVTTPETGTVTYRADEYVLISPPAPWC